MIRLRANAAPLPAVRVLLVFAAIGRPGDARLEAAPLRAGVAAESILRDNPSRPVHDPLYAKALVIGDGTTTVAIATLDEAPLRLIAETVELPRRNDVAARIESLERQQEEILQFFTGIGCGTHGAGTFLNFKSFLPLYLKHRLDAEHPAYAAYLYEHEAATGQRGLEELDDQNRQRVEKYLKCIEQMERLIRIRSNLEAYQRHRDREQSDPIAAEIVGLRVGDFALVTFPGEPFAEIALRIKRQSPLEHTLAAGYTNGHLGYAPTADAYDQEAYEDALTPFAPEWQAIYEQKALEILGRLAAP